MTGQVKKAGTRILELRFIMAPEDSSTTLSETAPTWSQGWQLTKAVLWIAFSVVTAMLIGQL